jgi:hypothetical protein
MKAVAPMHISRIHGLTSESYLLKYPGSPLTSPCSEERKTKITAKALERMKDPEERRKISEGTKKGMHEPESWKKFMDSMEARDNTKMIEVLRTKCQSPESKEKRYSIQRNDKVSIGKKSWWDDGRQGKTIEQLWGLERGERIRQTMSDRMSGEKNPAFGKVYENTGWKVGRYKGRLFRGILEYSFYKQLDAEGKLEFTQYEPLFIKYTLEGKHRTYTPDFLVGNELIEIKPTYFVELNPPVFQVKCIAAKKYCEENGLIFRVMTEKDLPKISYARAYADPDVVWIKK